MLQSGPAGGQRGAGRLSVRRESGPEVRPADPPRIPNFPSRGREAAMRKHPSEGCPGDRNTQVPAALRLRHFPELPVSDSGDTEPLASHRIPQRPGAQHQLIPYLAQVATHRDDDTGNHVFRVGRYSAEIARCLGYPEHALRILEQAARLHDIGKSEIPDAILFKPDRLTSEEYALMQEHCAIGRRMIDPLSGKDWSLLRKHAALGQNLRRICSCPMLKLAATIAQTHHEHWDGKGYPLRLKGAAIPLEGRIVAVADVFDALSSRRPYKQPFPRDQCLEILWQQRGIQFDPAVIDAFVGCSAEIARIQTQFMDAPNPAWGTANRRLRTGMKRTTASAITARELPVEYHASGLALSVAGGL